MAETEAHSETTLQVDRDVHCTLDRYGKFQTVAFKTSHRDVWFSVIQSRFTKKLRYKVTNVDDVEDICTFTMSGSADDLRCFYEDFDQMNENVWRIVQKDGGEAAQSTQQYKYHMVTIKSSNSEAWKDLFQARSKTNQPLKLSLKSTEKDITIIWSRPADEIKCFCKSLDQMRDEIKNIQKDQAAQGKPEGPDKNMDQKKKQKE